MAASVLEPLYGLANLVDILGAIEDHEEFEVLDSGALLRQVALVAGMWDVADDDHAPGAADNLCGEVVHSAEFEMVGAVLVGGRSVVAQLGNQDVVLTPADHILDSVMALPVGLQGTEGTEVGVLAVVAGSLDSMVVVPVGLRGVGVGAPAAVAGSLGGVMAVPVGLQEMEVGAPAVVADSLDGVVVVLRMGVGAPVVVVDSLDGVVVVLVGLQ
ncbi:unnamed protein product, partial [Gongylonema pulchrum]|uniref:Uncharacterized protein n=1 Tax=Gongylonema pulchrum TaxID=637853 RepID=A0A183F104_9BILA